MVEQFLLFKIFFNFYVLTKKTSLTNIEVEYYFTLKVIGNFNFCFMTSQKLG